jgi:hypothetical protein
VQVGDEDWRDGDRGGGVHRVPTAAVAVGMWVMMTSLYGYGLSASARTGPRSAKPVTRASRRLAWISLNVVPTVPAFGGANLLALEATRR